MKTLFKEYGWVVWNKKWYFLLAFISVSTGVLFNFLAFIYFKYIADELARPYSLETLNLLLVNLKQICLIYAAVWLLNRTTEFAMIPLVAGGVSLLEKRCFNIITKQSYDFFQNNNSGALINQVNRFVQSFEVILDWFLLQFVTNVASIAFSFSILYHQQKQFAYYFLLWGFLFLA